MADGSEFRDQILEKYDFTPEARTVLLQIPVEVGDPTNRHGGGFWLPSERKVCIDPLLEAREPELVEPRCLESDERLVRDIRERLASPELECLAEDARRIRGVATFE